MSSSEDITARYARLEEQIKATRERQESQARESIRRHESIKEDLEKHDELDTKRFDALDAAHRDTRTAIEKLSDKIGDSRVQLAWIVGVLSVAGSVAGALLSHLFGG